MDAISQTNAKRDGDDLIINGQKVWISSGMQADWICLLANTSEGNPHKNKSLIIVPLNSKGTTLAISFHKYSRPFVLMTFELYRRLKEQDKENRAEMQRLGSHILRGRPRTSYEHYWGGWKRLSVPDASVSRGATIHGPQRSQILRPYSLNHN